jgi:protein tyrosine/serine phosphatase
MRILSLDGNSVFRHSRPETPLDWDQLHQIGIKTLVSLESGWYETWTRHINQESVMANRCGMLPLRMQFSPVGRPKKPELDTVLNWLTDPALRPISFHCLAGVDRTGVMAMYYRVKVQGWSFDRALEEMCSLGFHRWNYGWWIPGLRKEFN